jgi:hypothetical protein
MISANSAVTVLRSPSSVSSACVSVSRIGVPLAFLAEAGACAPSAVPQSSQNLAAGVLSAPHLAQRFATGLPHSGQNFLPLVLSAPHLEQCISSPIDFDDLQ